MVNELVLGVFVAIQSALLRVREERGQTLAEYSLIMATIAVAVVVISVITFREALVGAYSSASRCLDGSCS
jgi:Flp pilus assembly pilin Flp